MSLNIRSYTISHEHKDWDRYVIKTEHFCSTINDRLYNEELNVDEWIALTVYVDDSDKIYGFSSTAARDYWPKGSRILSRFYKDPSYRFENNKRALSKPTLQMLKDQLEISKILGYEYAFMSRDTKTIKAWHHYSKYFKFADWTVSDKYYKMTSKSWQQIIWTPLVDNAKPNIESITKEKYDELQKT